MPANKHLSGRTLAPARHDDLSDIEKGDAVISPLTPTPYSPLRVTEVFRDADKTMLRISALGNRWLQCAPFRPAPAGHFWRVTATAAGWYAPDGTKAVITSWHVPGDPD